MITDEQYSIYKNSDPAKKRAFLNTAATRAYGKPFDDSQIEKMLQSDDATRQMVSKMYSRMGSQSAPKKEGGVINAIKGAYKDASAATEASSAYARKSYEEEGALGIAKTLGNSAVGLAKGVGEGARDLIVGAGSIVAGTNNALLKSVPGGKSPWEGFMAAIDKGREIQDDTPEFLKASNPVQNVWHNTGQVAPAAVPAVAVESALAKSPSLFGAALKVGATEAAAEGARTLDPKAAALGFAGGAGGTALFRGVRKARTGSAAEEPSPLDVPESQAITRSGADEILEDIKAARIEKAKVAGATRKNIVGKKSVTSGGGSFNLIGGEVGNRLRDATFAAKSLGTKVQTTLKEKLDFSSLEKLTKAESAQIDNIFLKNFSTESLEGVSDKIKDLATKLNEVLPKVVDYANEAGARTIDGELIPKRANYLPFDFEIPKGRKAFDEMAKELSEAEGIPLDEALERLNQVKTSQDSVGGRFGSFAYERQGYVPTQTRHIASRVSDYLEKSGLEIGQQAAFGTRSSSGRLQDLEAFMLKNVDATDREFVRKGIRTTLSDNATAMNKELMELQRQGDLDKGINVDPNSGLLKGFVTEKIPKDDKVLLNDIGKFVNLIGTVKVGFNASLSDLAYTPARLFLVHANLRAARSAFFGGVARDKKAIKRMVDYMDLGNSARGMRRERDIEWGSKFIDKYFTLMGANLTQKTMVRANMMAGARNLDGMLAKKSLTKADKTVLIEDFGFTRKQLMDHKSITDSDVVSAITFNTEKVILGRGASDMIFSHESGAWAKSFIRFLRHGFVAAMEAKDAIKRQPIVGTGKALAGATAVGYTTREIAEIGDPAIQWAADVMGFHESDKERSDLVVMARDVDDMTGWDDFTLVEDFTTGAQLIAQLDMFANIIGDATKGEFTSTSSAILFDDFKAIGAVMEDIVKGDSIFELEGKEKKTSAQKLIGVIGGGRDLDKARVEFEGYEDPEKYAKEHEDAKKEKEAKRRKKRKENEKKARQERMKKNMENLRN